MKMMLKIHNVYIGYSIYCTVQAGHVLSTAELDEFLLIHENLSFHLYFCQVL